MKNLLTALLLISISIGAWSKPFIIGKDQAPINAHDYAILKKVAENSGIPVGKFKHYSNKRYDHFLVGNEGMLYWDEKKNGVIDGDDMPATGIISRYGNSYMTDRDGFVIAIEISKTQFNNINILNGFKRIIAINVSKSKVRDVNLSGLSALRHLVVFGGAEKRVALKNLNNLNKLAYLKVWNLDAGNFKRMTGLKKLHKADFASIALSSFAGLNNMPNLKELEVTLSGGFNGKTLETLNSIPKGHKLEKLKLSTGYTTDITGIAHFSKIKRLNLWSNKRALTDLTPINTLKNLESLEMTVFGVTDFTFLKAMPKLKDITTYHAPVASLKGLSAAPNLESLKLYSGKLTKIEHLDQNTNLKTMYLNHHQISKLEGLSSLKKLNTLDISRNQIKKIEGLEHNTCLETFWINSNPVSTLENLTHLPILRELGIDRTKISELTGWQDFKRLFKVSIDSSQLDSTKFTRDYFYRYVPIKEIDMHMKKSKPITQDEYKQYGCL
jgi:Leucine-rich repeat (LRR) protein